MRKKGTIISWNNEKGFGFIKPNNNNQQVFVHIKSFNNRGRRPNINEAVFYSESADNRGRPRAVKVDFVGDNKIRPKRQSSGTTAIFVAISFLMIVGITVFIGVISPLILGCYVTVSLATFLWYAKDKAAAQSGRWRTPESTLHLMSLIGGWPGALIAQQNLRHKSKKLSFRMVFWATVLLNCGVFIWLFTPEGSAAFNSLISYIN